MAFPTWYTEEYSEYSLINAHNESLSAHQDIRAELAWKEDALWFVPEDSANKWEVNWYASLDSYWKVPSAQLPSYVDDVLEYADYASLPVSGVSWIIYITIDDNKQYRWSWSTYIQITDLSNYYNKQEVDIRWIDKHGIQNDWLWAFLSAWSPTYTFNLRTFTYFINWVKYDFAWVSNYNPWFLAWEAFAYIWVNASWIVIKKNSYFTISESQTTILVWLVRSTTGWVNSTLDVISDYVFFADELWRKIYSRYKNYERTLFTWTAWQITVTWLRPNILGWNYNNDNMTEDSIVSDNDFAYSYVYHVSWQYTIWALASQDINVTQFDDWTDLTTTSNNKFVAHTVVRSNINGVKFIIIGNAQYDTQLEAEVSAPNFWPLAWATGWTTVWLAKIVYKKWVWIVSVIDIRNNVLSTSSASSWTLQNWYDASTNPEITTDSARWALSIKEWTWSDSATVLEWRNNAWNVTSEITWDWFLKHWQWWRDNVSPFLNAVSWSNAPVLTTLPNWHRLYKFDVNDSMHTAYHMDHDIVPNSNSYPHVHFFSDTNFTVWQTVVWQFIYTIAKWHQQAQSLTWARTTLTMTYTADWTEVAWEHLILESTTPIVLAEPDMVILAEVKRVAWTATNDIYWIMSDLHYLSDREVTRNKTPNFYT